MARHRTFTIEKLWIRGGNPQPVTTATLFVDQATAEGPIEWSIVAFFSEFPAFDDGDSVHVLTSEKRTLGGKVELGKVEPNDATDVVELRGVGPLSGLDPESDLR